MSTPSSELRPSDPVLQFSRFKNGSLEFFDSPTTDLEYVAISHVWGDVEWQNFPGKETLVPLFKDKADFILNRLPELVGETPFWMDILNVDQASKAERVAVTQWIPFIFRKAIRTIAVREYDGLYDCCAEALRNCYDWDSLSKEFTVHVDRHMDDIHDESYLQRLWTLQECLQSRNIEFVFCSKSKPRSFESSSESEDEFVARSYKAFYDIERIMHSLYALAFGFTGTDDDVVNFIKVHMSCGSISSYRTAERIANENIYTGNVLAVNLFSDRVATKPRDYILAIAPQFPWYQQPSDSKDKMFGEMFVDLYNQAFTAGHGFVSRITQSMVDPELVGSLAQTWSPSFNQPEPECLGDFLKLMGDRLHPTPGSAYPYHLTTPVFVLEDTSKRPEYILDLLEKSMKFSEWAWTLSHKSAELSKYGDFPSLDWALQNEDAMRMGWLPNCSANLPGMRFLSSGNSTLLVDEPGWLYKEAEELLLNDNHNNEVSSANYVALLEYSRSILDCMFFAHTAVNNPQLPYWNTFNQRMRPRWPKPVLRTMLLLAAMVGCGLGLSAGSWANKHFVPITIVFHEMPVLGLLARHARGTANRDTQPRTLLSFGRHLPSVKTSFGCDMVLVDPKTLAPVGLVPDLRKLSHESETQHFKFVPERLNAAYRDTLTHEDSGRTSFNFIALDRVSPDDFVEYWS